MTRIIGGRAGGRTLATPRGSATRPTSDRVREALFSILAARDLIVGARVLDLYAGSGALGLEAASRGAAEVTLVEEHRATARLIAANAATLGLRVDVVTSTVRAFAGRTGIPSGGATGVAGGHGVTDARVTRGAAVAAEPGSGARAGGAAYDLVFADPPYPLGEAELAADLAALVAGGVCAPGAVLVLERSARSPEPTWPPGLSRTRERRYGETTLWFAVADEPQEADLLGSDPADQTQPEGDAR